MQCVSWSLTVLSGSTPQGLSSTTHNRMGWYMMHYTSIIVYITNTMVWCNSVWVLLWPDQLLQNSNTPSWESLTHVPDQPVRSECNPKAGSVRNTAINAGMCVVFQARKRTECSKTGYIYIYTPNKVEVPVALWPTWQVSHSDRSYTDRSLHKQ